MQRQQEQTLANTVERRIADGEGKRGGKPHRKEELQLASH